MSSPSGAASPSRDASTSRIYSDREAVDVLVAEGHIVGDVRQELGSLVASGLVLSQPPDEWLLTDEELALLRQRLQEQGE
jgi:hypothetical protein